MDRDDILNLYVVTNLPVPGDAARPVGGGSVWPDDPPFLGLTFCHVHGFERSQCVI